MFRSLGNRNARLGRWEDALQCLVLLDQANRLDDPTRTVEKSDLLAIAAALRAHGKPGAYERFRTETLNNFLPARNALQAEHLLKVSLMAPAGPEMLTQLEEAARLCADHQTPALGHAEWNALSLALYYMRMEDSQRALDWGQKCLAFPDPSGARSAAASAVMAMAWLQLGQVEKASELLRKARRFISSQPPANDQRPYTEQGSWFSWLIAENLAKEADELLVQAKR